MTTRADLDRLRNATTTIADLARNDTITIFNRLNDLPLTSLRDTLPLAINGVVEQWGTVAAAAAADWYEEVRTDDNASGRYSADMPPSSDWAETERAASGTTDYALSRDNATPARSILTAGVARHVTNLVRRTITHNISRDPAKPRWARVPSGEITCAFCTMLASRGFVYLTKETAGGANQFHDHCDCAIVPDWSKDPAIEGYKPELYFGMYRAATELVGNQYDTKRILAAMRELHPDALTDGVHEKPTD